MIVSARAALAAASRRELAANRVNRFLHVHLALAAAAGLLPLFTPDDAAAAAPLWVLHAVLYCLSLSALLLGLSSAHGEADEFALLFAQPAPRWAWLLGKALALTLVLAAAALLLVLPAAIMGGATPALAGLSAAAAGVTLALAALGLGVGFWVRDPVRGLLAALGVWFVLLFGTDLLLLAVAGAPWMHDRSRPLGRAPDGQPARRAARHGALHASSRPPSPASTPAASSAGGSHTAGPGSRSSSSCGRSAGFAAGLAGARRRLDA